MASRRNTNREIEAFRDDTIRLLTKLDTQVTQIVADREDQRQALARMTTELRTESKEAQEHVLGALNSHSRHDDARFDQADKSHRHLAQQVNRGYGGMLVLQFLILAGIALWGIYHH